MTPADNGLVRVGWGVGKNLTVFVKGRLIAGFLGMGYRDAGDGWGVVVQTGRIAGRGSDGCCAQHGECGGWGGVEGV